MNKRIPLDTKLKNLLGPTVHVYNQPPSNMELIIPACIYTFAGTSNRYADGVLYGQLERYTVKLIVQTASDSNVLSLLRNIDFSFSTQYASGVNQHTYIFQTSI